MANIYQKRRFMSVVIVIIGLTTAMVANWPNINLTVDKAEVAGAATSPAIDGLKKLIVKGRAPKTDYSRDQFGSGWNVTQGCDTRNIILNRDLTTVVVDGNCNVTIGVLDDPYTGKVIQFTRGAATSGDVQIDHVVALSDAWQKGAQQLTKSMRTELANDPLELLAVDGSANLQKLDGDAATWLPPNKAFRCQYIARQIAVKLKYDLWVTDAEYGAMNDVLKLCPQQALPSK